MRKSLASKLIGSGRRSWALLLTAAVAIGLGFGGSATRLNLRYSRTAVAHGQWWRLLTGNFVHLGWPHITFDVIGIALLWVLVQEVLNGWRWILTTILGGWAVGLGLWWAWPQVHWYAGLSGIDFTYWIAGALALTDQKRWEGPALLVFAGALLGWEQTVGPPPWTTLLLHEPIITSAHLIGSLAGLLIGLALIVERRVRRMSPHQPL